MADEVKFPIGKGILAVLFGFIILPISMPTAYFLALYGVIDWSGLFAVGFIVPMLIIGIPFASGAFSEFPESVTTAWVIQTVVGLPSLIIAMQFFDASRPKASINAYAMVSILIIISVTIVVNQYTDSSIIRRLYLRISK